MSFVLYYFRTIHFLPFCDISQTWFHVCTKLHCWRKHVCERKTLSRQPNTCYSAAPCTTRVLGTSTNIGEIFQIFLTT